MLGTYYYHEIIRKTIIGFGTIFNQINIKHQDADNSTVISDIRVPLAYGPVQKFLARIRQQPELNKPVQITLPRMSFEMTSIQYDPTRKASLTQTFSASTGTNLKKVYMPVPYNIGFDLNIMVKLNDDGLQIIEQILPYFQPAFNITINLVDSIGEKRDIPIVLESINFQDDYEGDFSTRRVLIYTLRFTAKTYLFGPIAETSEGLIKKVQVDTYTGDAVRGAKREMRYVVTPRAKKDYNNDNTSTLTDTISTSDVLLPVVTSADFSIGDRIVINDEIMYVKDKPNATQLYVERGYEATSIKEHLVGSSIDKLTPVDDTLVEPDDDFGFNETWTYLGDSKEYSPTRKIDY